jgi:NADH:ubiquinone oxidoreductase subunit E
VTFHPKMPYATGLHQSERRLPDEGQPFEFTPENRARLEEIAVQRQQGYISARAMEYVAQAIGCTPADVEDVVSYYAMFFDHPVGTYVLGVCRTLSCALNGAERVTDVLARKLGIKPGETDPTGMFTLVEMECLGACDRGPVIMVNDHWHECVTPEAAGRLVDDLRAAGPSALSGCHLCVEQRK